METFDCVKVLKWTLWWPEMSLLRAPEKMLPVVSVGLFVGSMNSRDYDFRDFDTKY